MQNYVSFLFIDMIWQIYQAPTENLEKTPKMTKKMNAAGLSK